MLKIEEGKIYLTKGDTAYLQIAITLDDGTTYSTHEGDTLTLSVKKDLKDAAYALQKVVAANEVITILPTDTEELEYGKYVYDVQLNTSLDEVFTIIAPSGFYLKEEVTHD